MREWIVYGKDGSTERCRVRRLEYNGEFMGACSVTVNISSPAPIDFELGDYLEYRGERFELNYDPGVVKQSAVGTCGEGFVYENVVFNSLSDELTRCDFLDYVPDDNEIHYSSLPTFSFFADNISKLAERIQVNLDRIYTGDKKWTVEVHPEYVNTANVNIQVSNNTVWDALGLANSKFGANFIIRDRTITIGTTGLAVESLFSYGKGNGLYKIEKNAESNQKIITRLRAYGSTRNMPTDYYKNVEGGTVPNNMAVKNLMLPSFPTETHDPYVDSENIQELGVREGTVFFDGSGDLEEIYPTMEGMTAEDLAEAGIAVDTTGALDVVKDAEQIEDNGEVPDEGEIQATFTVTLKDIGFDINDYLSTETAVISMKDGMCGGREFEISECVKSGSDYVLTCKRVLDEGLGLYFPYSAYQIKGGDKFVLLNIEMPDVYIKAASQRLLVAAKAYLAKNDYVRYSYTPTVDNIFMARQHDEAMKNGDKSYHDTIKEGDLMLFEDEDLGIEGSIIIDSLAIKEYADDSLIPEYEITLKNEKTVGSIEKIQNQISSILINGVGSGASLNTEQIQSIIAAYGSKMFLRKDKADETRYTLGVNELKTIDAVWSFLTGKGTLIKDGLIQTDRIEVRQSMAVMDLIINQLQGIAADFLFSDVGKVDSVTEIADRTYVLHIEKRTDFDFTTLGEHDVLQMIVNDLYKGGGNYFSSWMRVLSVDTDANEVTVVLYDDAEVPGGANYAPVEGYNLARKGNAVIPDTEAGETNERANYWMLSSREGRIQFLQNVFKPMLEDYNYALTLGKLPDLEAIRHLPVTPGKDVGLVAQTAIVENLYQFDYNGDIVTRKVDRGAWSLEVAQGDTPYRNVTSEENYPDSSTYYLLEQHTAWHNGCRWGCLVDKTTTEPKWNSPDWTLLEGNTELEMRFTSSEGNAFHAGKVDTYITPSVYLGNIDISEDIAGIDWLWTYELGEYNGRVLHLTSELMPPDWSRENKAKFTCTAYVRESDDEVTPVSNMVTV